MKSLFILLLCSLLFTQSFAQKTTLTGKLPGFSYGLVTLSRPTKSLMYDTPNIAVLKTNIDKTGAFSFNLESIDNELVILKISDSTSNKTFLKQFFYIRKGYNLTLIEGNQTEIIITGNGAEDNHLKGIETFYNIGEAKQDSVPDRIYSAINNFYSRDKAVLDSISKIYLLSANCKEALQYHLKYARLSSFYNEYGNLRINMRDEVVRNKQSWENTFKALQNEVELSDEKALIAPSYHEYLKTFLDRRYEDAIDDFYDRPSDFYREWFANDSIAAESIMKKDAMNQLKQKLIERNFTGKVKEQMYALLLDLMVERQLFANVESIFNDFKHQFPKSEFSIYFEKPFAEAIARYKNQLTDKMVFVDNIKSWNDILNNFKEKTVLLDMWGTWCAPCRQEINQHSAALKKYFENKGLTFLYITNHDTDQEKWKQLIAFYNLEGSHIFASRNLSQEIMQNIKGTGYPTYAIIDKYGKVIPSEAGYPMNRNILIQQIEEVLRR